MEISIKKIYIDKKIFFYLMIFLPTFLSNINDKPFFLILDFISVFIMLFLILKNNIIYKELNMVIIFFILIIGLNLINGVLSLGIIYSDVSLLIKLIYIYNICEKNSKKFIVAMQKIYFYLIIINFISLFTTRVKEEYFLGGKNSLQMIIVPGIVIIFCSYYLKCINKFKFIVFNFICITTLIYCNSSTSILVSVAFIIFMILNKFLKISLRFYNIVYLIAFFMIIIIRKIEILNKLVVGYFGKDLTFSGRTEIWDFVLECIKERPLLGYGRGNNLIQAYFQNNLNESHNGILELLLSFGLIPVIVFFLIIIKVSKKLYEFRKNKLSKIISLGIFMYFIISLTESVFLKFNFWILLILGLRIKNIIEEKEYV